TRFGIKGYGRGKILEEQRIEKLFNVKLVSFRLGISGIVDMAIITTDEVIPVDFKDGAFSVGEVVAIHHKYQLLTYGLILEETYRKRAKRGFIHSLEDGTTKEVHFTEGARMYLMSKLRKIRVMLNLEIIPDETPYKGRCRECEFKPICRG
ncbi:MAG TPA: CRISPR-associated protein Cas4, partial [Syntrophorhabdaceae bacterium]|nr:CRISPR-associated protein Cas4 [Syntrophorhabdaceae bacterium]